MHKNLLCNSKKSICLSPSPSNWAATDCYPFVTPYKKRQTGISTSCSTRILATVPVWVPSRRSFLHAGKNNFKDNYEFSAYKETICVQMYVV